jgi:hypothetical protein
MPVIKERASKRINDAKIEKIDIPDLQLFYLPAKKHQLTQLQKL